MAELRTTTQVHHPHGLQAAEAAEPLPANREATKVNVVDGANNTVIASPANLEPGSAAGRASGTEKVSKWTRFKKWFRATWQRRSRKQQQQQQQPIMEIGAPMDFQHIGGAEVLCAAQVAKPGRG